MQLPAVAVSQSPEDKFREYLTSRGKPQRFTEQQRDTEQRTQRHYLYIDIELSRDRLLQQWQRAASIGAAMGRKRVDDDQCADAIHLARLCE